MPANRAGTRRSGKLIVAASWKERINISPYLIEPLPPLICRAGNNDTEGLAVKAVDTTKTEDAIAPNCLEGVTKGIFISFSFGVGRIEYHRRSGFQQSVWYSLARIPFDKLVRNTGTQHSVDPTFQYGRRLA